MNEKVKIESSKNWDTDLYNAVTLEIAKRLNYDKKLMTASNVHDQFMNVQLVLVPVEKRKTTEQFYMAAKARIMRQVVKVPKPEEPAVEPGENKDSLVAINKGHLVRLEKLLYSAETGLKDHEIRLTQLVKNMDRLDGVTTDYLKKSRIGADIVKGIQHAMGSIQAQQREHSELFANVKQVFATYRENFEENKQLRYELKQLRDQQSLQNSTNAKLQAALDELKFYVDAIIEERGIVVVDPKVQVKAEYVPPMPVVKPDDPVPVTNTLLNVVVVGLAKNQIDAIRGKFESRMNLTFTDSDSSTESICHRCDGRIVFVMRGHISQQTFDAIRGVAEKTIRIPPRSASSTLEKKLETLLSNPDDQLV